MHYNWTVYPEGRKRLEESGLDKRVVQELAKHKKSTIPFHVYNPEETPYTLEALKEEGYFKATPFDLVKNFGTDIYSDWHMGLLDAVKNHENSFWQISRHTEKQTEAISLDEDIGVLSGFYASIALTPKKFWQYEKFGFDSLGNFLGTVGAFTRMKDKEYMEKCPRWQAKDGQKTFETQVTGSSDGDFRLFRTDITPYETRDPMGNKIFYRPQVNEDSEIVAASHSVEPYVLGALLKYAEQEKIPSEILKNHQEFIKEMKSSDSFLGAFGDAGDWGAVGVRGIFICHDLPIPRINSEGKITERYHRSIPCYAGETGNYALFIGQDNEFVFSYENPSERRALFDEKNKPVKKSLTISPGEVDSFIRALFLQSKQGLGRTSLNQMVETMDYYFSKQFKIDQKEEQDYHKRYSQK